MSAAPAENRCSANPYSRQTSSRISASTVRVSRGPTRSMTAPISGCVTSPAPENRNQSSATVPSGCSYTVTSVHSANVMNTCLRTPNSAHSR